MIVLGIETTCDETAVAIVRDGHEILSNVVFSQTELHQSLGGVMPELACRKHLDMIFPMIQKALDEAHLSLSGIDLISVAEGPGLVGALIIGVNVAKTLAYSLNRPFVGVNHVEAHIYSAMMQSTHYKLPALGLVISGGHTLLVKIESIGQYKLISTTVDDAIGECFDKVAKMLSLPYPGGPEVEKLARKGDPNLHPFKPSKVKGMPLYFSFSGLKTQVMHALFGKNQKIIREFPLENQKKCDIAASFQLAAISDVIYKTILAAHQEGCSDIFLGGGVSSNSKLRELFSSLAPPTFQIHFPPKGLSIDNAAMIAGLGYHNFLQKGPHPDFRLSVSPRLSFAE